MINSADPLSITVNADVLVGNIPVEEPTVTSAFPATELIFLAA